MLKALINMKIAPPLLAKKAVLVLRALAKAAMPMVRAEVNKVKDVVVHGSAKKKKNNHEGGIAIRSSRPAMDLDLDFMPAKLLSKEMELTRDARACNSALAVISCDDQSVEHEDKKLSKCYPMQRIDEDVESSTRLINAEEINQMADAFISDFHQKMRLEKQQSYRRYEDMLARGT